MATGNDPRLVVRVGQALFALPARAAEGVLTFSQATSAQTGTFLHDGSPIPVVDLRHRWGLEAGDGQVLLARAAGSLRGFVVDEVLGGAPADAQQTNLPTGLPAHTFQGALLHAGRSALLCDFEALYTLEDAGTTLRILAESPPATPAAHLPLHEALRQAAAHLRDRRQQPVAAPPETTPTARRPTGDMPDLPSPTKRSPVTDTETPPPLASQEHPVPTASRPKEALTTAIIPAQRMFVYPLLATAAMAGLAVLLLPLLDRSMDGPGARSSPLPRTVTGQAAVSPAPADASATPPPPQATADQSSHHESPAPAPVLPESEIPSAAQVHVEHAADGVTLVVEHADQRAQGEKVTVHTVEKGDTLWAIAARYLNDPWAYKRLAADSAIKNPDLIQVGDKVRIIER